MGNSFLFISPFIEFEETDKGVSVNVTFMELDKTSENGKIYLFSEAKEIAKSIIGRPIFFGTKIVCSGPVCKRVHDLSKQPLGFAETAKVVGKRIIGKIRVTCPELIKKMKEGKKYWLSVGGVAERAIFTGEWTTRMRPIKKLIKAIVTHVSVLPKKAMAGFKTAKIEGFSETLMMYEETLINEIEDKEILDAIATGVMAYSKVIGKIVVENWLRKKLESQ